MKIHSDEQDVPEGTFQAPKQNLDDVLIVFAIGSFNAKLAKALSEKGYTVVKAEKLLRQIENLTYERKLVVIISGNFNDCNFIAKQVRCIQSVQKLWIVCVSESATAKDVLKFGQVYIEEFLPKSVMADWIESRITELMEIKSVTSKNRCDSECTVQEKLDTHPFMQTIESAHFREPPTTPALMEKGIQNNGSRSEIAIVLWLISDQQKKLDALEATLSKMPCLHITSVQVKNWEVMQAQWPPHRPDVVLVDTNSPLSQVKSWLIEYKRQEPKGKIILLYDDPIADLVHEVVNFGICGLLNSGVDPDMLIKAVQVVYRGQLWLSHDLIAEIVNSYFDQQHYKQLSTEIDLPVIINNCLMTKREISIIKLVSAGKTNKEIAKELSISPETVKKHLKYIFEKSCVKKRSQLVSVTYKEILKTQ